MNENVVTWESLTSGEQADLEALAAGFQIFRPNAEKFVQIGLAEIVPGSLNLLSGEVYRLTPAGRALLPKPTRDVTVIGCKRCNTEPAVAAGLCAGCVGSLEGENERLKKALKPFATQMTEYNAYLEGNGEMSLLDFFTDYLDDEVLRGHLEYAEHVLNDY